MPMSSKLKTLSSSVTQNQLIVIVIVAPFILFPTVSPILNAIAWGIIIAVWAARRRIDGKWLARTPVDAAILLWLLILPVNIWATIDTTAAVIAVNRLLWGMALFFALFDGISSVARMRVVLLVIVLGGLFIAGVGLIATDWNEAKITVFTGIYAYLPDPSALPGPLAGRSNQIQGLFHPNVIAVSLGIIIPLGIGLLAGVRAWWQRAVLLLALPAIGGVFLLTQSRLAIAALLAALGVMALSRWRKLWVVVGAVAAAGVGVVIYVGWNPIWAIVSEQLFSSGTGSWNSRMDVWRNALNALTDFPFTGVGLSMFEPVSRLLYPYYVASPTWVFRHAHDIFLQAGLDFGLGGLVAFVAVLLGVVWMGQSAYRRAAPEMRPLVRGMLGSLGVYVGFGLFDCLPFWVKPGFLPWLIFGLIGAGFRMTYHPSKEQNDASPSA